MAFRNVIIVVILAGIPVPGFGQNMDANAVINLGGQILKGLQQQAATPQPAPAAPQAQRAPVYELGQIHQIQSLLAQLGYDPGPADGVMGPTTGRAIREFQADQGLHPDGVPSDALLALLTAASGAPPQTESARQGVPRPSFDCAKAGSPVEFAICGSGILAEMDRHLSDAYTQALAQSAEPERLKLEQRHWIQNRDRCGANESCLADAMESRTTELRQLAGMHAAPATAARPAAPPQTVLATRPSAQPAPLSTRDDGILVHANGGLIVPAPLISRHGAEFQQHRAIARYLLHAAAGSYPDELVPADNPSILAQRARDYLSLADVRPYLCTPDEMTPASPDCLPVSDAIADYSMNGGELDPPGDVPRDAEFLWWRGANEFERRRNIAAFVAPGGPRDQIIASAPKTPVQLVYRIAAALGSYDFGASAFPVLPAAGQTGFAVPGSNSGAFNVGDLLGPIAVPQAEAEALRSQLSRHESGRPDLFIGVTVELTPDEPHGGQPRWTSRTVSAGYFLDEGLTRPLEPAAALAGQSQTAAVQRTPAAPATVGDTPVRAMRDFHVKREDGRIVLDYKGYGEPTVTTREGVLAIVASAAREILKNAEKTEKRYDIAAISAIVNDEIRAHFFADRARFAGQDEFAVQRNRQAFRSQVAPRLIDEAPALPLPMRLYLEARLEDYDFDKQGFPVRTFQDPGVGIDGLYPFSLEPAFELAPDFVPMPPDTAETLVSSKPSGLRLRIDFQVTATSMQGPAVFMAVRTDAVALVAGGTVYFQKRSDGDRGQDATAVDAAAMAYLGPQRSGSPVPDQPTDYPIMGVAPGMTLDAARKELAENFSAGEIRVSDDVLHAEHGLCRYAAPGSDQIDGELGTTCLLARVRDGRIARVVLRQVMATSDASQVPDEWARTYGKPVSRGDGAVPEGAIGREFQDWGAELAAPRADLGRAAVEMASHQAELDITYLSPQASVVVSRSDYAAAQQPEAAPEAAAAHEPAADAAAVQTTAPTPGAEDLPVVGIRLGMPLAEALEQLKDVGRVIYKANVKPEKPELVQNRFTLVLIDNGESFVLNTSASEGSPVIGLVRRIPVNKAVPASAIKDAFVGAYGAPLLEEADGEDWITWRWEKPENRSAADVTCAEHFIGGMPSGGTILADEEKDVDAIVNTFPDSKMFASDSDKSFFRSYLRDKVPRINLSMQDQIGSCGAFLNIRFMASQTQANQIWLYLVDPQAFAHELANIAPPAQKSVEFKP